MLERRSFLRALAASLVFPRLSFPSDRPTLVARPEYERTLGEVLVSVPADTLSFGAREAHDDLGRTALGRFLEAVFYDVFAALPSYTTVHVVARSDRRDLGLAVLKRAGEHRSQLHVIDAPGVEVELWAQDLGEPVLEGDAPRFLVGKQLAHSMGDASKMSVDRKRVAELVFGAESVDEAPFCFEGGNLAFDRAGEVPRVLMGTNLISRTIATYRASGRGLSKANVLADVGSTFGRAEVVEMGREQQSPLLQHIDQAFVILAGGVAVAVRMRASDLEGETRQLETFAGQLRELGYRVERLDHAPEDVKRYQSSVNVVPFVDASTGERRILFPVFPGEVAPEATALSRDVLRGKALRAFDLYRDLGYTPCPLRDVTHGLGGNTHCILNALS